MASRVLTVFAVLVVAAVGDSPVAKVITLLEDLKKEVETVGTAEATTYGKFACFCKDTTDEKGQSITDGNDKIQTLSANIAKNTADKAEKEKEVVERKVKHKKLGEELTAEVSRCSAMEAKYEYDQADMKKALSSLKKAIKAMNDKKAEIGLAAKKAKHGKVAPKSLLEISENDEEVKRGLLLVGIDPNDPAYKYHSQEITELLEKLQKDFEDEKKEGTAKFEEQQEGCQEKKDGLDGQMKENLEAISAAEERIEELKKKIAKDREDLVDANEQLEADTLYLKDLTKQCEAKAKEYDQRAGMRNDEIEAISQALEILTDTKYQDNAEVLEPKAEVLELGQKKAKVAKTMPVSFLQTAPAKAVTNFLARASVSVQQDRVISLLRSEGSRLGSTELSMLAMQLNGPDHFKEVKSMIQKLIERLMAEEIAEASKKGFCDTEIGKAKKDRDHTQAQADEMSADLKALEATKEELEAEIKELKKDIEDLNEKLDEATELRKEEKEENMKTLKKAKEGLDATKEAILILKAFYSQASRARVLLQVSPVDADSPLKGEMQGAYKGQQKGSREIFHLLENIAEDFDRTIKETEKAEADAQAEFVEFDRNSKADIAGKETKVKLDKQDLETTNKKIISTLDDLETTMGLQKDAIKMIESLKPACLDAGGLNYKERTAKRNEEIAALKEAIKVLSESK